MDVEKQIFADMFNFLKDNFEVRKDQGYWTEVLKQTTALEQKYKGNKFAKDMLYACIRRLCDICDNEAG